MSTPDALKLEMARKAAVARGKEQRKADLNVDSTLTVEECFVRLVIEMYASGTKLGFGVMPDGMAIWCRLSVPTGAHSPYAGRVSFVVSNEHATLLSKAVAALEAAPDGVFWKADAFAR